MKPPKKKQTGGFGINPSMMGLFNGIDLKNLDFAAIADLGSKIGGEPFNQAMAQDDPSIYVNSIVGNAGRQMANQANPLPTPEETKARIDFQTQANTQAHQTQANATGASMFTNRGSGYAYRYNLEEQDKRDAAAQQNTNNYQGFQNSNQSQTDYAGLLGAFNLFSQIGEFKKGGKLNMQNGGYKQATLDIKDTQDKLMAIPDTKDGRKAVSHMLTELGVDLNPTLPNYIKLFKKSYGVDLDEKGRANNKITPELMKAVSSLYRDSEYYSRGLIQSFEDGGKSRLGYSDNSPFKNEPSINITSNVIDMSKTSKPLMAYPDIGTPKLMKPNSGIHVFPDATSVTEVPVMSKGGKKKKKMTYFQDGGQAEIPKAVQLEEGELIATPQLDILDTSAKEGHEDMKNDVVTDIIRPEDYVFSFKNKIKLKEAENISFGLGAMHYEEGEVPDMPEEQTAAILFKKGEKEMPIAEFVDRIRKRFPITDKEDVFSNKTNDANKAARLPLLAAAVHINEVKRTKGKGKIESFAPTFVNKFEDSIGAMAGVDNSNSRAITALPGDVPEGQDGGLIGALNPIGAGIQLATGLYDAFIGAPKRKRIGLRALEADQKLINQQAASQAGYAGLSNLASIAGVVGQDPTVSAPQYDSTQLDQRIRRAKRTLFDFAAGRISSQSLPAQKALFENSGSFAQSANAYAPIHSSNVGAIADLGFQEEQMNIGLQNQYSDLKQAFNDRQTLTDTTAKNATRTNVNALTSNLAGQVASGVNAQGAIESNRQGALRNNELNQAQVKINASKEGTQSFYNLGENVANFGYALQPPPTQPVNNNLPYITPPSLPQAPNYNQVNGLPLTPIQPLPPLAPYQGQNLPYNQGSTVPRGPNSRFDPATGLWFG